jgi:hypothetical protein
VFNPQLKSKLLRAVGATSAIAVDRFFERSTVTNIEQQVLYEYEDAMFCWRHASHFGYSNVELA